MNVLCINIKYVKGKYVINTKGFTFNVVWARCITNETTSLESTSEDSKV